MQSMRFLMCKNILRCYGNAYFRAQIPAVSGYYNSVAIEQLTFLFVEELIQRKLT